jgi:hypothetical protein
MSMKDKVGKVKEEHGGAVCAMQGGIFQVRGGRERGKKGEK